MNIFSHEIESRRSEGHSPVPSRHEPATLLFHTVFAAIAAQKMAILTDSFARMKNLNE